MTGSNPSLRGGRRECYHSATVAPYSTEMCGRAGRSRTVVLEEPYVGPRWQSGNTLTSQSLRSEYEPRPDLKWESW